MAAESGMVESRKARRSEWLAAAAPFLFVFLWSTGFIGAKYGLPYAEPFTFLAVRMVIAATLLALITVAIGGTWPRSRQEIGRIAVAGVLLHAGYLGGVFFAIDRGMPAGISSLIVGLQPILTAVLGGLILGEQVIRRQWIGLILGFIGVALVIGEKLTATGALHADIPRSAEVAIVIALLSTTAGTLYQKRYGTGSNLAATATIQYIAAGIVLWTLSFLFETQQIEWTRQFILAMTWLVFGLSIGAILILLYLISRNSVARVSSFLYLVPPATAIEAYLLFDERLGALALAGMVCVVVGVALVVVKRG